MARETGRRFPALEEEPELTFIDEYYLGAFFKLCSSRNSGMGLGAIPLSEILTYGDRLEGVCSPEFIEVIQHADSVYIDEHNKKQEKELKKK